MVILDLDVSQPEKSARHFIKTEDGTTISYDMYQPTNETSDSIGDYTMVVAPGMFCSSEDPYIKRFVPMAQSKGFRVAVQNHLGVLKDVQVTSPKILVTVPVMVVTVVIHSGGVTLLVGSTK